MDFPGGSVTNPPANSGDPGSISGSGSSPRERNGAENGNPLQYSCPENSMDRGVWRTTFHGVTKSWIPLRQLSTHTREAFYMLKPFILLDSLKSVHSYWEKNVTLFHITFFPALSKSQILLIFLSQVYTAYNVYHENCRKNTQVLHFVD